MDIFCFLIKICICSKLLKCLITQVPVQGGPSQQLYYPPTFLREGSNTKAILPQLQGGSVLTNSHWNSPNGSPVERLSNTNVRFECFSAFSAKCFCKYYVIAL